MTDFISKRDRDASPTIRGFVLQVDRTIEQWLLLKPNDILELERGEDIDIVSAAFADPAVTEARLLEQVKHLEKNITLRTAGPVGALASAVEHLQTNPDLELLFQFTTTANIGKEQQSPLGRVAGIGVWEEIRGKKGDDGDIRRKLVGLRQLLWTAQMPEDFSKETWTAFQQFVLTADHEEWLGLVRKFRWNTGAPLAAEMSPRIERQLIDLGHAANATEGREIYQRLFLHVFKLLTLRGIKRLSPDDLAAQVALPTLSETDHALLNRLQLRMSRLEVRVDANEQNVSLLQAQVEGMKSGYGFRADVAWGASAGSLDLPPLVPNVSLRAEAVAAIRRELDKHVWVALHGNVVSGRTQLCSLVVLAAAAPCVWIRLQGLATSAAGARVDAACEKLIGPPPPMGRAAWLDALGEQLGAGAMIVLDSLPRIHEGDELSETLAALVETSRRSGLKLLSNSAHPLPEGFVARFNAGTVRPVDNPQLVTTEIGELFAAHGAPDGFLKNGKAIEFIGTLSGHNPAIVAALARHLRRHDWRFDQDQFSALLDREHAGDLNRDTLVRLLATVEDDESRDLLYRLNLIAAPFGIGEVDVVAAVHPPLAHPRERLERLLGLWIARDDRERMRISPLIETLGSDDLDPDTRKRCHFELGARLMSQQEVNQLTLLRAVNHFVRAEDFDRAGFTLALGLSAYVQQPDAQGAGTMLLVWDDQPLPEQMSLAVQIYLRSVQLSAFAKAGKPYGHLSDSLDTLVNAAAEGEAWAVLSAAISATPHVVLANPGRAHSWIKKALIPPNARFPSGDPATPPGALKLESLILLHVHAISTPEHLDSWMTLVEELTPEQRQRAFTGTFADECCMGIVGLVPVKEHYKPEALRDWAAVDRALANLGERARRLGLDLLWACTVHARITAKTDFYDDLPGAVAIAEEAMKFDSGDTTVHLLLHMQVGVGFFAKGDEETAFGWFSRGFEKETGSYPAWQVRPLIQASVVCAKHDSVAARRLCERAVTMAENAFSIGDLVMALGELALCHWAQGDLAVTFGAWIRAAEVLLNCEDDTDEWRSTCVGFGSITGALNMIVQGERPEIRDASGTTDITPRRGILLRVTPAMAPQFRTAIVPLIYSQLVAFAEAVGDEQNAEHWLAKGLEDARSRAPSPGIAQLRFNDSPRLLLNNQFAESFFTAHDSALIFTAAAIAVERGIELPADLGAVLGERPNPQWEAVDVRTVRRGLWPIVFRLGLIFLENTGRAAALATEVVELCRNHGTQATFPQLWQDAATLLHDSFIERRPAKELLMRGSELIEHGERGLAMLACLGGSLDATLFDAIGAHITVAGLIEETMKNSATLNRKIAVPFFSVYWRVRLDRSRAAFRSPQQLESALETMGRRSIRCQTKFLLKEVAAAFAYQLRPEIADWLDH